MRLTAFLCLVVLFSSCQTTKYVVEETIHYRQDEKVIYYLKKEKKNNKVVHAERHGVLYAFFDDKIQFETKDGFGKATITRYDTKEIKEYKIKNNKIDAKKETDEDFQKIIEAFNKGKLSEYKFTTKVKVVNKIYTKEKTATKVFEQVFERNRGETEVDTNLIAY